MLQTYLPALVFVGFGVTIGTAFALLNRALGPRGRRPAVTAEPYESGLPSEVRRGFRFGVSFYLLGILFILFDLEVVLLLPVAVVLSDFGLHGALAAGLFIALLGFAFLYEWAKGSLDWRE